MRALGIWIMSAAMIALVGSILWFGCGCATQSTHLDHNNFPPEITSDCLQAQAAAVKWYRNKYHEEPIVPFVYVRLEDAPINGKWGGLCVSAEYIRMYRYQKPWMGSLEHEFRHSLNKANRKLDNEETVK